MLQYSTKPELCYAIQNEGDWEKIVSWLNELAGGQYVVPFGTKPPIRRKPDGTLLVDGRDSTERVPVGDWVIFRGIINEFYACSDSVFRDTYMLVEDPPEDPHRNPE